MTCTERVDVNDSNNQNQTRNADAGIETAAIAKDRTDDPGLARYVKPQGESSPPVLLWADLLRPVRRDSGTDVFHAFEPDITPEVLWVFLASTRCNCRDRRQEGVVLMRSE